MDVYFNENIYCLLNAKNPFYNKKDISQIDIISFIGLLFNKSYAVDKFDILNKYSIYKLSVKEEPQPVLNTIITSSSFREVSYNVYNDISKNIKYPPHIMWSGGVDSTYTLIMFLKFFNIKNVHVIFNEDSIEENPIFYEKLLHILPSNNFHFYRKEKFEPYMSQFSEATIIASQCADQLFGSVVNQRYPNLYFLPWKEAFTHLPQLLNVFISKHHLYYLISLLEDYFSHFDIEIKLFCEAIWFLNFSHKWIYVRNEMGMILSNNISNNIVNFYDDVRFQQWSIHNMNKISQHHQIETKYYKYDIKKEIYDFDKNYDYFTLKGKISSKYRIWDKSNFIHIYSSKGYNKYCIQNKHIQRIILDSIQR